MACGGEKTFLVESYVPQIDESFAAEISVRVRAAVRQLRKEGIALDFLRSYAVIDEETYLCIVAARDLDHVVRLSERAGLECEHVVEMMALDPSPSPPA